MKAAMLAGAITLATATVSFAEGRYWVVGNRATSKCDIVTRNPVIYPYGGGDFWFADGPYLSKDEARLARSTIGACPKEENSRAACDDLCARRYYTNGRGH